MALLSDKEQRELVELARSRRGDGGVRALEQLLADFRAPALAAVHKALASCGIDGSHAEEALQQAVLKFVSVGLEAYRGSAAPRTFFVRIAINAALDVARRMARLRALDEVEDLQPEPSAEERLSALETRRALELCIDGLPERYLRSVRLYYLEQAGDCAACAARLGITKEAFMQQLCRARSMLAECLRRRLG